ncbi:unnamed protein product [Mucor fragilis]
MVTVMKNFNVSVVCKETSIYLEKDCLFIEAPRLLFVPLPSVKSFLNKPLQDFDFSTSATPVPATPALPAIPTPAALPPVIPTTAISVASSSPPVTPAALPPTIDASDTTPATPALTATQSLSKPPVLIPTSPSAPVNSSTPKQKQQEQEAPSTPSKATTTSSGKRKKIKQSKITLNYKRFKPECVVKFANLFTLDQALKKVRDEIIRHSVKSLEDIDSAATTQTVSNPPLPNELFPQPALGLDVVAYFNLLNSNLVRSSKETTLLRARSNQNYLDFANSLQPLNQDQKYYLQQQVKNVFMKSRRDPDVVELLVRNP